MIDERRVVAANRESFRHQADTYDQREVCLGDRAQRRIGRDVRAMLASLAPDLPRVALDCGAGTGALGMHLLRAGFYVTAIDLSPEMLARFRAKADAAGASERLTLKSGEASAVLASESERFSFVGCSAFLHHVPDYVSILCGMADRVAPGGWLYLAWEPLDTARHGRAYRGIVALDLFADLVKHDPLGALAFARDQALGRRESAPDLTDFHAALDADLIASTLRGKGLEVESKQFAGRRTTACQLACDSLRLVDHFAIKARRAS